MTRYLILEGRKKSALVQIFYIELNRKVEGGAGILKCVY